MKTLLQYDRPQSMYDSEVHHYISTIINDDNFANDPDALWAEFKDKFHNWIVSSKLNSAIGLDQFLDRDIIAGVTQFIDDIHQMKSNVCVLEHEYRYHWRLYGDNLIIRTVDTLQAGDNLILSMPFPYYGDIHPDTDAILYRCNELNIDVHIDACWFGCSRDIVFNFDQPCIKSVGFSLSKALGMGANRIGVRYCRQRWKGPVSIINEFNMNTQILVWMGIKFIDKFGVDFWQNKYGAAYAQICKDYNLTPTKSIHLAWDNSRPCGVRPLLRALVK